MNDWWYICEKCGEPCSSKSSRKIEDGPDKGKIICMDCLIEDDPYRDY